MPMLRPSDRQLSGGITSSTQSYGGAIASSSSYSNGLVAPARIPSSGSSRSLAPTSDGSGHYTARPKSKKRTSSDASRTSTVFSAGQAAYRQRKQAYTLESTARDLDVGRYRLSPAEAETDKQSHVLKAHRASANGGHEYPVLRWIRLVETASRALWTQGSSRDTSSRSRLTEWAIALAVLFWIKWAVGLGGWSGKGHPPLFGDMEAQRNWLSLTIHVPIKRWYWHNLQYWGLDYPPLTAYHSWILGKIAHRLGEARWVELVGRAGGSEVLNEEHSALFMRYTQIASEFLLYLLPLVLYLSVDMGRWKAQGSSKRSTRTLLGAFYVIALQPCLLLIDSGHFQYNSVMLGLAVCAAVSFRIGNDCSGAVFFVASMCFKQMAIYYAPAVFAYLLGKCLWMGGADGLNLFISLAFCSLSSLIIIFLPFLWPVSQLQQAILRIFPLARGLFEDKVANAWCAINVVLKLRSIASTTTLARLSLAVTFIAVLPLILGMSWLSKKLGAERAMQQASKRTKINVPPTVRLLPHALFASAMAFFLFSFQVHEKGILLPLMPLTLLLAGRQPGLAGQDFEWSVFLNNVGSFSLYPLLQRDGLALPAIAMTIFWNFAIGLNPLELPPSFTKYLMLVAYSVIAVLLLADTAVTAPAHLPDIHVVLNVLVCFGLFSLGWLWSLKRLVEEGWGLLAWDNSSGNAAFTLTSTEPLDHRPARNNAPLTVYDNQRIPQRKSRSVTSQSSTRNISRGDGRLSPQPEYQAVHEFAEVRHDPFVVDLKQDGQQMGVDRLTRRNLAQVDSLQ